MKNVARRLALQLDALRGRSAAAPHFIRDYTFVFSQLLARHDFDAAMQQSSGGNYDAMGSIEAAILVSLGLRDGHSVVDVGCGSGRLSSALQRRANVDYLGTDIMAPALDYARARAPTHYRFMQVHGLDIPADAASADFVTFFSVATHLMHHETFLYLEEAKRVAKPGGYIVMSFLELANPAHWKTFARTVEGRRRNNRAHLNTFIEADVFAVWAKRLGLELAATHPGGSRWVPISEPIRFDDGNIVTDLANLGQSAAIMRKPE